MHIAAATPKPPPRSTKRDVFVFVVDFASSTLPPPRRLFFLTASPPR
jgi:hypothetical protein